MRLQRKRVARSRTSRSSGLAPSSCLTRRVRSGASSTSGKESAPRGTGTETVTVTVTEEEIARGRVGSLRVLESGG